MSAEFQELRQVQAVYDSSQPNVAPSEDAYLLDLCWLEWESFASGRSRLHPMLLCKGRPGRIAQLATPGKHAQPCGRMWF
jgi:hypothetical protein